MARIYHVSYEACTDVEPQPGWYIGGREDEWPGGPFPTKTAALEAAGLLED